MKGRKEALNTFISSVKSGISAINENGVTSDMISNAQEETSYINSIILNNNLSVADNDTKLKMIETLLNELNISDRLLLI